MTRRLFFLALLVATPALTACGRQGPLRLPEQAPPAAPDADAEDSRP